MLVEGRNAVDELIKSSSTTIEKIMVQKDQRGDLVDRIKGSGVVYQFVEKVALDRVSKTRNHQGFIAFVSDFKYSNLKSIVDGAYEAGKQPLLLILDGVEDPHNLGNIVRTAECLGVDGIVLPKNRSAGVNSTVSRVSAGAVSHMKICKITNINTEIEALKKQGFWIYACELGGSNLSQTNLLGPIAIVMGGEGQGVRTLTRSLVDGVVTIPMMGKVNSLNVGSATSIILYEIQRQRSTK